MVNTVVSEVEWPATALERSVNNCDTPGPCGKCDGDKRNPSFAPMNEVPASNKQADFVPTGTFIPTVADAKILAALAHYDAPFLQEKMIGNGTFTSPAEFREAFVEFKKYAALSHIVDGPMGMISDKVDQVWHQFILFTRQYAAFCQICLGSFLHHAPHTSATASTTKSDGVRNFVSAYQRVFGEIPEIWLPAVDCAASCNYCSNGPDCRSCSSTCS